MWNRKRVAKLCHFSKKKKFMWHDLFKIVTKYKYCTTIGPKLWDLILYGCLRQIGSIMN